MRSGLSSARRVRSSPHRFSAHCRAPRNYYCLSMRPPNRDGVTRSRPVCRPMVTRTKQRSTERNSKNTENGRKKTSHGNAVDVVHVGRWATSSPRKNCTVSFYSSFAFARNVSILDADNGLPHLWLFATATFIHAHGAR